MTEVETKDVYAYDTAVLKRGRIEFYYNRQAHELTRLFYLIASPEDEEKMPVIVLKIIDGFLAKNIPKICDFFVFTSLKKVLQRTDWLKPASEEFQMLRIPELKRKFMDKFPNLAREHERAQLANSFNKVSLAYYVNHENMLTGGPKENFDPRKTKIKDDKYNTLFEQLVHNWTSQGETLEKFDSAIIESPKFVKRKMRKSRLNFISSPENIDEEDMEELDEHVSSNMLEV